MNLRTPLGTALWTVRAYPGTTALLAGASAITVGVSLPPLFLGAGRLALPAAPDPALPVGWSQFAGTPATMQTQGIESLAAVLVALGVAALAVGVLTAGSLAAGRAGSRRPEIAVRRAVGATRNGLRMSGLIEGGVLIVAALALGLFPALAAIRWATAAWPGTVIPAFAGAGAAGATVAVTLLLGALAGVRAPGGTRVPHAGASSHGLVIPAIQFAFSLSILMAAAQAGSRAKSLLHGDSRAGGGFAAASVFGIEGDPMPARRAERYAVLLRQLRSRRDQGIVSLSASGALVGLAPVDFVTTDCGACSEGTIYTPFRPVPATITAVTADTFLALGLPALRGRVLTDHDGWGSARVAVVSASLAAADFEDGYAVGRRILIGRGIESAWYRVVGVVPDHASDGIGGALEPAKAVYVGALQVPPLNADLLVQAAVSPATIAGAGRVAPPVTLGVIRARQGAAMSWFGSLAKGAGWAVLVIALAGMVAVMERWVAAVSPELAVRRAVGAPRAAIARFVFARALGVGVAGALAGMWIGMVVTGLLQDAFPGLPAWTGTGALVVGAGLLAATLAGALGSGWNAIRDLPAARLAQLDS